MLGREPYHHPWAMAEWDQRFFGESPAVTDRDVVEDAMVVYMERFAATGEPWTRVSRHMMGLRDGQPGARKWRQVWSDHRLKSWPASAVSAEARRALVSAAATSEPGQVASTTPTSASANATA